MRWIVGLLLVTASALKAVQLLTEPALAMAAAGSFLPFQIGIELGIGFLALTGFYWRHVRWVALVLFIGFAGYSLYLALNGAASCGCFGPVHVHPWWMFFLDVAVVMGLSMSLLGARRSNTPAGVENARLVGDFQGRRYVIGAIMGVSVLSAAMLVRYANLRTAIADGLQLEGDLVILEPEQWIGKKLPIADFIDVDLSTGEWVVLLHRHDCLDCQEAVPKYEQLALAGIRVALVEVPPYGGSESHVGEYRSGRLHEDREWFVQTPVEIQLRDGVVVAASTELPALLTSAER